MATDKTATWSLGESLLWYSPNFTLDHKWSLGESDILDEYVMFVPALIRTITIDQESRSIIVPSEARHIGIDQETRSIIV